MSNDSSNSSKDEDEFTAEELRDVFKMLGYDIETISEQIDAIIHEWCNEKYNITESDNDVE